MKRNVTGLIYKKEIKLMYKLIVLDCDGTLLNSKKEITDRTLKTINAVVNNGVKIMLASARPFYRLKPIIAQLGIDADNHYTISFNGGLVTNNTESEILFSREFSAEQVNEIVNIGKTKKTNIFLYARKAIYSNFNDEKYKQKNPDVNFNVVDFTEFDFNSTKIYKIAYVNSPEDTIKLRKELPNHILNNYEISSSVPQFVEIVPKGITKADALMHIQKKLCIKSEDIIAFGDQDNDIPMLIYAGCGIAMGNSPDVVKETASFITTSNDEDGVAVALEHFFKI